MNPTPADFIRRLNDERLRAIGEQRKILDAINERGELAPTAEERQTLERMDADIEGLKAEIDGWVRREAVQAEAERSAEIRASVTPPAVQERIDRSEADGFLAFLRGRGPGNSSDGRGWEFPLAEVAKQRAAVRAGATNAAEMRALTVGVAAVAGTLVPTSTFVNRLYDYLEVVTGARRMGATVITTASGEQMDFPKVATGGTAAAVNEAATIGTADATFGRMSLNAYKYGQLVIVSREMLDDSGVDLEGFLARDFGRALGRVTNTAYTTGTGSSAPAGYQYVAGTAVTGANGGTGVPAFTDLVDTVYSINSEYRAMGAVWTMRDATAGYLRKITDGAGFYVWQPSMQAGEPDRLLGFPVVENSAMPAYGTGIKSITFGDMSSFYIRDVGSVRVERSDEAYFTSDQVAWRALLRTDSDVIDSTAYKAFRGGTA